MYGILLVIVDKTVFCMWRRICLIHSPASGSLTLYVGMMEQQGGEM